MTTVVPTAGLKLVRRADESELELDLQPLQGLWTEEQYLRLSEQSNQLIEFTDGTIEVLPMPTSRHQMIVLWLYERLKAAVGSTGGLVLVVPLRLRIRAGVFREPDLLLLREAADPRCQDAYWLGADLVVEVVSPDSAARDLEEKPKDYAEAGIVEYWIVDPQQRSITVLTLDGGAYRPHGVFRSGERASSVLLEGFGVWVDEAVAVP